MILVRVLLGGCSWSRGALYDQLRHLLRSFRGLYNLVHQAVPECVSARSASCFSYWRQTQAARRQLAAIKVGRPVRFRRHGGRSAGVPIVGYLAFSSADRRSRPVMIELAACHHARRCLGRRLPRSGSVCRSHLSHSWNSSSTHSGSS
jgi:hypothetical protein